MPGFDRAASFVAADRVLLGELAKVHEITPGPGLRDRIHFPCRLARALAGHGARLAVLWFAAPGYGSITALACRWFRVPLIVIAGGADVAARPGLSFGAARGWKRALVRAILERAAAVWAFSAPAVAEIRSLASPRRLVIVPPVVDTGFYAPRPCQRERLVLTTCAAITRVTIGQKGLDRLLEAARAMPDTRFVVTGRAAPGDSRVASVLGACSSNVELPGFVSRERLRTLYARARVYAQLSTHEGFGVAVAEGLAMGCTPVVSDLPALRAIAGDDGYYVAETAPALEIAAILGRALDAPSPTDRWADIDQRFGRRVRRAAWRAELERLGASQGPGLEAHDSGATARGSDG